MVCKLILLSFVVMLLMVGCSYSNRDAYKESYYKNHYANEVIDSFNRSIEHERQRGPAPGFASREYSEANWSKYWSDRIYFVSKWGEQPDMQFYSGPSSEEVIKYVITRRRRLNLPELDSETLKY